MDQIDMMETRKREYIQSKRKSLLDYGDVEQRKKDREDMYLQELNKLKNKKNEHKIVEMKKKEEAHKSDRNLDYYLSDKFLEKMEFRIMEINAINMRKELLKQLSETFS